jgi:hypothetical protein
MGMLSPVGKLVVVVVIVLALGVLAIWGLWRADLPSMGSDE